MTPDAEGRDKKIAEDYQFLSAAKLSIKYRLSVPQIRRILGAAGVIKGPKQALSADDKVIDEDHRKIGMKLYFTRSKKYHETHVAAPLLCWSVKKLRSVEQGHTQLTLMDLKTIAEYLGIPLTELVGAL